MTQTRIQDQLINSAHETLAQINSYLQALQQVLDKYKSINIDPNKSVKTIKSLQTKIEHGNKLSRDTFHYANKDNHLPLSLKKQAYLQFLDLNKVLHELCNIVLDKCIPHCPINKIQEYSIEFKFRRMNAELNFIPLYPKSGNEIEEAATLFNAAKLSWTELLQEASSISNTKIKNMIKSRAEKMSFYKDRFLCTAQYNFAIDCMQSRDISTSNQLHNYTLAWEYFSLSEALAKKLMDITQDETQKSTLLRRLSQITEARTILLPNFIKSSSEFSTLKPQAEYLIAHQKILENQLKASNNKVNTEAITKQIIENEILQKNIISFSLNKNRSSEEQQFINYLLIEMETLRRAALNDPNCEEIKDLMLIAQGYGKSTTTKVAQQLNIDLKRKREEKEVAQPHHNNLELTEENNKKLKSSKPDINTEYRPLRNPPSLNSYTPS